jgi:hypothetical protein
MSLGSFWPALMFVCVCGSAQAGFIEICKESAPLDALDGLFSFTVAGQAGTFIAPVGACTFAFELPDGLATITENPENGVVVLGVDTFPANRLISFDPLTRSAVVQIVPGDISTQTVVIFTNGVDSAFVIPEPGTIWLLGSSLAVGALLRIRRRTHSKRLSATR